MKLYKITKEKNIDSLANTFNKAVTIALVVISAIVIFGCIFLVLNDDKKVDNTAVIAVCILIVILFYVMLKQVKDMMRKLVKHKFVSISDNTVTLGIDKQFKAELNWIQTYMYNRNNRLGVYNNKSYRADKIKSITKTNKGLQLKISGTIGDRVLIPKEMDDLIEIEQQIQQMIKR